MRYKDARGKNVRRGKRYHLNRKKIKQLTHQISEVLPADPYNLIKRGTRVEVVELISKGEIILINEKAAYIKKNDAIFPSLLNATTLTSLPSLTVDTGAISHICNGADVMAPGVVKIEGDFDVNDIVVVNEERFSKVIALAKALFNSKQIIAKEQGKIAETLHFIGDQFWEAMKSIE